MRDPDRAVRYWWPYIGPVNSAVRLSAPIRPPNASSASQPYRRGLRVSSSQAADSFSIQPRAWASLLKALTFSVWPLGQVTRTYHSENMPKERGSIFGLASVMAGTMPRLGRARNAECGERRV
jgi:hypothetical protein